MNPSSAAVLAIKHLSKSLGGQPLFVDLNLEVQPGSSMAILGESGSGKSTLLHLMAGLDKPDQGEVWFGPTNIVHLNDSQLADLRVQHVGLVFQAYYLMPHLTALQNIELPFLLAQRQPHTAHCLALLDALGLTSKAQRYPRELSGGEQQRVAIARALALSPPLILADEPTGNLDESNADGVLELLLGVCKAKGCALVMVTHSEQVASRLGVQYRLAQQSLKPYKHTPQDLSQP